MAESTKSNPARDLVRIHRVITRGLTVGIEKGNDFEQAGFPKAALRQGFRDYNRSLAAVLGGHHQAEDSILFPALKAKLPQAPFGHLEDQHRKIEAMLVAVNRALDDLSAAAGEALVRLVEGLQQIRQIWEPHIRMEESVFSFEALSEVLGEAEQTALSVEMGKFSSQHSNPPYLVVPFVLFNLAADDRADMLANLPATFMEELVLKEWKDQWAPMKPYLLE